MTITLNNEMRESLRRYINAKAVWGDDPMRAYAEARSYAAEFTSAVVAQLGGDVSREQHQAYQTGGPAPFEIQMAATLAKLEASNG